MAAQLVVIGGGRMGEALVAGLLGAGAHRRPSWWWRPTPAGAGS